MPHGSTQLDIYQFLHRLSSTNTRFNAEVGPQAARGSQGTPAQRVAAARGWQHPGRCRRPIEADIVGDTAGDTPGRRCSMTKRGTAEGPSLGQGQP